MLYKRKDLPDIYMGFKTKDLVKIYEQLIENQIPYRIPKDQILAIRGLQKEYHLRPIPAHLHADWKKMTMETCRLNDFLQIMEPWLDRDYVHKVYLDDQDHLVLSFADGGQKSYHIEDCTAGQLQRIIEKLRQSGIVVEKIDGKC